MQLTLDGIEQYAMSAQQDGTRPKAETVLTSASLPLGPDAGVLTDTRTAHTHDVVVLDLMLPL